MDRTSDGGAFRRRTIVDEDSRECRAIDVARKLTSEDGLERRGSPEHIGSDACLRGHGKASLGVAWARRREDALHRARVALGERRHSIPTRGQPDGRWPRTVACVGGGAVRGRRRHHLADPPSRHPSVREYAVTRSAG